MPTEAEKFDSSSEDEIDMIEKENQPESPPQNQEKKIC